MGIITAITSSPYIEQLKDVFHAIRFVEQRLDTIKQKGESPSPKTTALESALDALYVERHDVEEDLARSIIEQDLPGVLKQHTGYHVNPLFAVDALPWMDVTRYIVTFPSPVVDSGTGWRIRDVNPFQVDYTQAYLKDAGFDAITFAEMAAEYFVREVTEGGL